MNKGESIDAEQILEDIEFRRQVRNAIGFGVVVVLAVAIIMIIW